MGSDKTKMARRMMSSEEIRKGVPIFDNRAWQQRRAAKAEKVRRREERDAV